MKKIVASLALLAGLLGAAPAEEFSQKVYDMRGDMGLLEDFGPTGACWINDLVFLCDRRYTVFHLFDVQGRRFQFLEHPQKLGEANFSALCHYKDDEYFVSGSHYHVKNHPRFVENRSVMHKVLLQRDRINPQSGKENYRPDRALRASGYYGESTSTTGEITGIAMDPKHNRLFVAMDKTLSPDGSVVLLEGALDKFLARSEDLELKFVTTGLKPTVDSITNTPYDLQDIAYLPDRGLVLLLSAQANEGKTFGHNQLWFMRGGNTPAKLVQKDLASGNRGTGLAIRPSKTKDEYEAAIVCDNNMEDSRIPSRLVHLRGLRLPMR